MSSRLNISSDLLLKLDSQLPHLNVNENMSQQMRGSSFDLGGLMSNIKPTDFKKEEKNFLSGEME